MADPSPDTINRALEPFGLKVSDAQAEQVRVYLELLLRWNRRLNLTSVREPGAILTRHFGESLYLTRILHLNDQLLVDVGSGAGFPGLALKIPRPELRVVLVESVAKKATFLKEAVRILGMHAVRVEQSRFEELAAHWKGEAPSLVTARAVGHLRALVAAATKVLALGGTLALYLGRKDAESLVREIQLVRWQDCRPLPGSRERVILLGTKL